MSSYFFLAIHVSWYVPQFEFIRGQGPTGREWRNKKGWELL